VTVYHQDEFDLIPRKHYRVIYADPPTDFKAGKKGRPQHYPRMSDRELMRLPLDELAHPDGCWLFLWVTSPKLADAFEMARAWGFKYSARAFVWVKTAGERGTHRRFILPCGNELKLHMSQGYTTRKNAEDCLLFRLGQPERRAADVHEIILSPLREHSRKPDEALERIERFAEGPYLELFSRSTRDGWDVFGNEPRKFDGEHSHVLTGQ